jgi:hypothetical protein
MAGIAAAFAAAQVAKIASMKPGGGGSLSVGGSGGGIALPAAPEPAKEEVKATRVVNVYVYGNVVSQDEFAREILPSITKAFDDGVR